MLADTFPFSRQFPQRTDARFKMIAICQAGTLLRPRLFRGIPQRMKFRCNILFPDRLIFFRNGSAGHPEKKAGNLGAGLPDPYRQLAGCCGFVTLQFVDQPIQGIARAHRLLALLRDIRNRRDIGLRHSFLIQTGGLASARQRCRRRRRSGNPAVLRESRPRRRPAGPRVVRPSARTCGSRRSARA